jgi:hypothetical protein
LEEDAANGWPDWAALWADRVWVIELKTEPGSHRAEQLPYYLRLAAAAHPGCSLDLTYITGPLMKPAPTLLEGQRYSHLVWDQVVPLIKEAWGHDTHPEVAAYVEMITMLVSNLGKVRSSEQRKIVLGLPADEPIAVTVQDVAAAATLSEERAGPAPDLATSPGSSVLTELARATAADGHQRAAGAQNPEELEALRDRALADIGRLARDDVTRFVLPWFWDATRAGGHALTPEGEEFGYELRFSRYKQVQVKA